MLRWRGWLGNSNNLDFHIRTRSYLKPIASKEILGQKHLFIGKTKINYFLIQIGFGSILIILLFQLKDHIGISGIF